MGAMTPEERHATEALLADERQRVLATEAGLVVELASIVEASDQANLDDEHDPEGATVGYERARVASLLEEARNHLSELDRAADRLQTGRYGDCTGCGRPIGTDRLAAHPCAQACIACASSSSRPSLHRRSASVGNRRESQS